MGVKLINPENKINKIKRIVMDYTRIRGVEKSDSLLHSKGVIHNCIHNSTPYEVLRARVDTYWKYSRVGRKYKVFLFEDSKLKVKSEEYFQPKRLLEEYEIDKVYETSQDRIISVYVGDNIFLDSRLKKLMSRELNKEVTYFENFFSCLGYSSILPYSSLTIHALNSVDLDGKTVLDFGAGFGCLGLFAYKKGAGKYYGIERDDNLIAFKRQILLNDFNPEKFRLINKNIKNISDITSLLPAENINLVVANLGDDYGNTDLKTINLVKQLSNVETVIISGYTKDSEKCAKAVKKLKMQGFCNMQEYCLEILDNNAEQFIEDLKNKYNHSENDMEVLRRMFNKSPRVALTAKRS